MAIPVERKINELNQKNIDDFLTHHDTFLFDCDGVIWTFNNLITNANHTIEKLRSFGKRIFFVTNNSCHSRDYYLEKFRRFNIDVKKEEIMSTAYAMAYYLKRKNFQHKVFIYGSNGLGEELKKKSIQFKGINEFNDKVYEFEECVNQQVDPDIKAVAVGFDPQFNYKKLTYAYFCLQDNPGCQFIASNEDRTFPVNGRLMPGGGTIVAQLRACSDQQPIVLGKPHRFMFEILQTKFGLEAEKCCMVGDRLDSDILFGMNCNMSTLLVFSGVHTEQDVLNESNTIIPTYCSKSLGHLLKYL